MFIVDLRLAQPSSMKSLQGRVSRVFLFVSKFKNICVKSKNICVEIFVQGRVSRVFLDGHWTVWPVWGLKFNLINYQKLNKLLLTR